MLIRALFEDTVRPKRMIWTLFICLLFALRGNAQQPKTVPPGAVPITDADESRDRLAREMAKKANAARQVLIKNDTDRLLKLAVELKDSVDKSNENVLSLDVMKKAEEIEKLARSVKDKMKGPS